MNKKIEISFCRVFIKEGKEYIYRYFLIETVKRLNVNGVFVDVPCYGIEVISEEFTKGRVISIDGENVEFISPIKAKVLDLINFLKSNEVSPVHLVDIIGDYVDEWVEDFERDARDIVSAISLA